MQPLSGRPTDTVVIDEADDVDPDDLPDPAEKPPVATPTTSATPPEQRELTLHELNMASKASEEQARKARYEGKSEAELIIIRAEDEAVRIITQAKHQANAIISQAQAAVANLK